MNKNSIKIITGLMFLLFFSACVKENYDTTPEYVSDWNVNMTIAELKATYAAVPALIDSNLIIKGKVISSDLYGNFYKELFIEDETGGLSIRLDDGYLYEKYPVGRTVYVKCEGLYLGTYNGVYQLGIGSGVDRLYSYQIEDYLDIDTEIGSVTPRVLTLDDFNNNIDSLIGTFVRLENVQFQDTGNVYADQGSSYTTRTITACSGGSVVLSTSSFADFANDSLPVGNGSIDAVLSKFSGDYQLRINSTEDVKFTGDRCSK